MSQPIHRRHFLTLSSVGLAAATLKFPAAAAEVKPAPPVPGAWSDLPIRALLLSAPETKDLALFCKFIREALPREGVNTLVLRIEYRYQFQSRPELADFDALSRADLRQIVQACKEGGVKLIPCTNLFAHQSEQEKILPLLAKYPQFDESPDYNPPHPWKNGGAHDFYTKSLCPLHPDLYPVIFSLMDELVEVCEADAFHAGLDEVWIIAYPKCPRCGGRDPAEIFAGHVTQLRNHLAAKGRRLWIWSDRLIDGKTTNLLAWQASMNNTWRAIDLIPKDVLICDWKYVDAPPTPALFALKGFDVLPASCDKADVALAQLELVYLIRKNATRADFSRTISDRMQGMFETSWMDAGNFIRSYYGTETGAEGATNTFKTLFAEIRRNNSQ
ncbi:MAG TPA: family 20 glycosylhydrolase [Dongiaceae bacterium]|nr:family 20 glycosylhydrolase [Dongiaceae bacterium]